jgi:HlyD family secretion protein
MKNKKKLPKWIIPVVIVVVLVGAFLFFFNPLQGTGNAIDLTNLTTTPVEFGSISTGIGATGTVRTNQNANLAWAITGKVEKVLVKKGDKVTADQILAQIDLSSSAGLVTAQANLVTAQQNLADLQDVSVAQANAQIALINAQTAVTNAQEARDYYNLEVTQAQIDTAYATYLTDRQQVDDLQKKYDALADRPTDDLERAQALSALTSATAQMNRDQANLNFLQNYVPNAEDVAQADANLALAKAQLEVAQANWDAVKDGPDQTQIASAQANINSIQTTLDQQYIRAPFAGTITDLAVQPGDLVNMGTYAFQIDDMGSLYVDLQVSEVDINNVNLAQVVDLAFDAVPGKQYTGSVTDISSIGTITSGLANFKVTVKLQDADSQVKPGMTATATVVMDSAQDVLLVPNRAIATLGNDKVVYVLTNGQLNPVVVTVGLVSDTQTQITSGNLQAGDIVVTNPSNISATPQIGGSFFSRMRQSFRSARGSILRNSAVAGINPLGNEFAIISPPVGSGLIKTTGG